jgi:hypothetical protein
MPGNLFIVYLLSSRVFQYYSFCKFPYRVPKLHGELRFRMPHLFHDDEHTSLTILKLNFCHI